MKVVCESCQAKYQVPDARVAGKKLKIRCKRCGATVLIRGDLAAGDGANDEQSASAPDHDESAASAGMGTDVPLEWHVSLDGETRGPYSTEELKAWLSSSSGAWDAHVWREGFPDWIEARACAELGTAPLVSAAPTFDPAHEDEGPTQTFEAASFVAAPFMARAARTRTNDTRSSAIRSRTANGGLAAAVGSPRASAEGSMTGERHEDSVLFSAPSLHTVGNSAPAYQPGPNPGFAGGEGSGLIDIRALASLARQTPPRVAGSAATTGAHEAGVASASEAGGLSFGVEDEDARAALMNQPSTFSRIDSLAPVSNTTQTSNVAVPLAILGGCALVAAAVFAAILIARPSRPSDAMTSSVPQTQEQDALAATAQPNAPEEPPPIAQPPAEDTAATTAAGETRAMMPDEPGRAAHASDDESTDALAAKKRAPRAPRTAADEKKSAPEEKAKPKKEEKSEPISSDEVMLAEKAKPKPQSSAPAAPAEPKPEKSSASSSSAVSEVDSLLGAKPAAKPSKSGGSSIDDLLSGAVGAVGSADKGGSPKPAAPAPVAASASESSAASDLPEQPSRDETLAAMRGIESGVRACAVGQNVTGTATVEMAVSGSTGRVTTANVTGITGTVGSCIARAVRNAKFPRFTKSTLSIKYPYRF